MEEKERLQIEIDLLMSLNHVQAWTGSLDELRQRSYVLYSDIIAGINERRAKLKSYDNGRNEETISL